MQNWQGKRVGVVVIIEVFGALQRQMESAGKPGGTRGNHVSKVMRNKVIGGPAVGGRSAAVGLEDE